MWGQTPTSPPSRPPTAPHASDALPAPLQGSFNTQLQRPSNTLHTSFHVFCWFARAFTVKPQVACPYPDMATTFGRLMEDSGHEFDFIDLNCGCPVESICKYGVGAGMLDSPNKIGAVSQALSAATSRPVTIKV